MIAIRLGQPTAGSKQSALLCSPSCRPAGADGKCDSKLKIDLPSAIVGTHNATERSLLEGVPRNQAGLPKVLFIG